MTREKALEIAGTGANVISGSDQACLMNIAGMFDRLHKDGEIDRRIKVMHIAEIFKLPLRGGDDMALIYDNRPYKTRIKECLADDFKVAAIKNTRRVL